MAVVSGAFGIAFAAGPRPSLTCTASQVYLSGDLYVSPETGEHAREFVLTNRSRRACALDGYPSVRLYDRRGRLVPFRYQRGGEYIRVHRVRPVVLRPRGHAYFVVAKYRCDVGVVGEATHIRARPPGVRSQLRRQTSFDYCRAFRGQDRTDPGNLVHLSPLTGRP